MSAKTSASTVFAGPEAYSPPTGTLHQGDRRAFSSIHFGGPEDIQPIASVANTYSENITKSSVVLAGPESFTHTQLLRDAAAQRSKNKYAEHSATQSTNFLTTNQEPAAAARRERGRGACASTTMADHVKLSDDVPEAMSSPPKGYYLTKESALKASPAYAGFNTRSNVGEELQWRPGPRDADAAAHRGGKASTQNSLEWTGSVADALVYNKVAPLAGKMQQAKEFGRAQVPNAPQSTIGTEAMSWHAASDTNGRREAAPQPTGQWQGYQQTNGSDTYQRSYTGAHEQHSPAAYSRAQYQHEGNYPSMMQGDGEQQTWRHMQMHDHNGKLQDPTLENRQTTVGAPPLRFSSVASRQQNPQASLYTTSAQRLGPPSLGGSPPPPLYSGAYADMAKMSTKFTRQFAPPQPGTAFLNM